MTVLTACREAAVKLNQTVPTSVFTSTDAFAAELALAANEAAEAIVAAKEWQKLKTLATMTGDGAATSFALPSDYHRMLVNGVVHSATWQNSPFTKARDEDDWIYTGDLAQAGTPGKWIILGGRFQVLPAMPVGETARFYYISRNVVAATAGGAGTKTAFTVDTDELILPERLLRLAIVWRWRSNKRMEYAEDMQNFEIACAEEMGADKGSNILMIGRQRWPADVRTAYPRALGP
jgi:hypothetical protein